MSIITLGLGIYGALSTRKWGNMKQNIDLSHRRTTCRLQMVGADGKPYANKLLHVSLKRHQFLFGCGAFDALAYVTEQNKEKDEQDAGKLAHMQTRVEEWLNLYNYGTLPFYWGGFEPKEGEPQTENRMAAAKFLTERGVKVKGHPLCWHTVCANWLMQYDNETILKKQLDRINREVTGFKGTIDMWDVINEVVIMPIFDRYDNAVTRICKEKGRVGLIKEVFKAAKEANPEATLLLNDFNTSTSYEILVDGCLEAGVPITAIGIQSHQHQGYWGAAKVEEVLERFEHFGLPIHFTENTLVSGHLMPPDIQDLNDYQLDGWPTSPEGEERQKKELEEMYRILFSHPQVEAITGWDFADGAWLDAPSGVIRKDNSRKPSYQMLERLIKKEWTTDGEFMTDDDGFFTLEGYMGEYLVESKEGGPVKAKFTLSRQEKETKIHLQ